MIYKESIYHLVWVKESKFEILSLESAVVLNEIPEIFRKDMPRVPLEREFDYNIGLLQNP